MTSIQLSTVMPAILRIGLVCVCIVAADLGCSPEQALSPSDGPRTSGLLPYSDQQLNVFNWSDYIDPELILEFERRTGARVQYDNYSSEAELETKLVTGGGGYDVIFPSDRSMAPLVAKGLLAGLDKKLLPNLKNVDPKFLGTPHDPENHYSIPYFWGTVAVGIRTDHVKESVEGFEILFNRKYRGRITMLDDAENVVAAVMLHLGHPMNSTDERHLKEVKELLVTQRPLVQAYTSDTYKEKLIKGEAWIALGWSGDILQAAAENQNIQAIVPRAGTMIWGDSMAIPSAAENRALAHAFIDFLLEADIAARNANYVRYASPNNAAKEKMDTALLNNPAIFPPKEVLDRCQWLRDRGPEIVKIENVWREVKQ